MKSFTFRRKIFLAVAGLSLSAVTMAVMLQVIEDLTPCPLCILQRIFFLGVAVSAAALGVVPERPAVRLPLTLISLCCAAACIAVAGQHYYEQTHPLEFSTCAPGFEAWWNQLFPAQAIPLLFQATGQCMLLDVTLAGLPLPVCSMGVAGLAIGALAFATFRRSS